MTSAETSAPSLDPTFAESKGGPLRRFLAPFAVGLALLSTFLTFVVLTGLTRIQPTPEVVISFLLINTATILLLAGIIVREVWQVVQARRRGRAAARLHVQIVSDVGADSHGVAAVREDRFDGRLGCTLVVEVVDDDGVAAGR